MDPLKSDSWAEELARRMVALDDQAFREFADVFGPRFRSLFLRHGLPVWEAEDLAVSCVTDIALKVDRYKPTSGGSFVAWVFHLARHAMVDWWRGHKATVPLDDALVPNGLQDTVTEPNLDIALAVRDAVAQLPETDQLAIQLRDLGPQHSYAEIGARLGMQPGTVRVRHTRTLRRLKLLLEKDPRLKGLLDPVQSQARGE